MAKGKRSGHRAEDVIASHAMKHHDFVGGADAEREQSQRQKDERVAHEREQEVLHELARANAGETAGEPPTPLRPGVAANQGGNGAAHPDAQGQPRREGVFVLIEDARERLPEVLAALREKAEQRLSALPRPVKILLHRSEQAAALLFAPARIGVSLAREVLNFPLLVLQSLRRHEA